MCLRSDLGGVELDAARRFVKFLSDNSLDWADGGQTNLGNLASLCGPHHRFIHQHHITGHVDSTAPRGGRRVRWHVMRVGFGWRPAPPPEPDEVIA